jgi:hypothetical protein
MPPRATGDPPGLPYIAMGVSLSTRSCAEHPPHTPSIRFALRSYFPLA